MTPAHLAAPTIVPTSSEKAITLALSLAQAEKAIHDFTAGQVDAIVDADGRTYLLRPAQEQLRDDESRLSAILESMAEGATVIDRCGTIISQNRAATRMLGYGRGDLVGTSFFGLVDAGELLQFHAVFFNVLEEFRANAFLEIHLLARDGFRLKIEATVAKLHGVAGGANVVTSRRAMARDPANESRLQAIIDSAADIITVVNRSGVILSESHAVSRLLGYSPEELVGRSIFQLIYEEDVDRLYTAFFNVIEGLQENATVQFYHPARDGSYRLVEASVAKLGDLPSVVLILRPVAGLRREVAKPRETEMLPADEKHDSILLSHGRRIPLTNTRLGLDASASPPV